MLVTADRLLAYPGPRGQEGRVPGWDRLGAKECTHPAARGSIYNCFHQLPRVQGHGGASSRHSPAPIPPLSLGRAKCLPAWPGCRRASAGAALVPIPATDNSYREPFAINRSEFQFRGEKERGTLSQAQMSYGTPQAQQDPVLLSARIQAWALLGAFGAAAALESRRPQQNWAGKGWRVLRGTRSCRDGNSPRGFLQHCR